MTDPVAAATGALERPKDAGEGAAGRVAYWRMELELASKAEEDWRKRVEQLMKLYRSQKERSRTVGLDEGGKSRFNLLFSNTQTLSPALYNQQPNPDVRRRFRDADPVGKVVAEIIERALSYSMDAYDFDGTIRAAVLDYLLPGRAVARVRYDADVIDGEARAVGQQKLTCEIVNWRDFRLSPCQCWRDVRWIAFRHRMTRDEMVGQFGAIGKEVSLDWAPEDMDEEDKKKATADAIKRGEVWEIWDRVKRQVAFMAPSVDRKLLDEQDDPLGLENFFPVPRPLYSIESNDDMVPTPEYDVYADQARELNEVTRRIGRLTEALRARGVYDGRLAGTLSEVFDGDDNTLVAIDAADFMGPSSTLANAIWMVPLGEIIAVLQQLYVNREQIKQTIYEITGLADILRGSTVASETATAQQIKTQWGTLRLDDRRREVQRFIRDILRIKAEIVAEHFDAQNLSAMTGVQVPPEVLAILRDQGMRSYRIDVETDSTIAGDAEAEKQAIVELVTAIGRFIVEIGPAVQGGSIPIDTAKTLLMAMVRRFRLGREVEDALDQIGQQGAPGGQPQPDPAAQAEGQAAMIELQTKQVEAQAKAQESQIKLQTQQAMAQVEQARAAADVAKIQRETQADQQRDALELQRMQQEMVFLERKQALELQKLELEIAAKQAAAQATA